MQQKFSITTSSAVSLFVIINYIIIEIAVVIITLLIGSIKYNNEKIIKFKLISKSCF